ncbi:MAG: hypothetical protein AAF609_23375 [Cyanobacteria bacterium P01_C01_bin.120]
MPLNQQPQPTVIENQDDCPSCYLPHTKSPERPAETPAALEKESAIAPAHDLTDAEFSPERPGPAWMWEFGVMG